MSRSSYSCLGNEHLIIFFVRWRYFGLVEAPSVWRSWNVVFLLPKIIGCFWEDHFQAEVIQLVNRAAGTPLAVN